MVLVIMNGKKEGKHSPNELCVLGFPRTAIAVLLRVSRRGLRVARGLSASIAFSAKWEGGWGTCSSRVWGPHALPLPYACWLSGPATSTPSSMRLDSAWRWGRTKVSVRMWKDSQCPEQERKRRSIVGNQANWGGTFKGAMRSVVEPKSPDVQASMSCMPEKEMHHNCKVADMTRGHPQRVGALPSLCNKGIAAQF